VQQPRAVETLGRWLHQRTGFGGERRPDSDRAAGDHPVVVEDVGGADQLVERGQRGHGRDRDEVASPEAADLALHTALLMGPVNPWAAEERVEPVVAAQRGEPFGLGTVAALEDPDDRRFEIVVADPGRHPAEVLESQDVALQERLLSLGSERDVKCFARVRQSHHEHPALHHQPGDRRVELTEVNLGLSTGLMGLRDRHLLVVEPQFDPPTRDVTRHRHLRAGGMMFGDQTLPDPPGGMTLLARSLLIGDQPSVDHRRPLVDRRPRPRRVGLARRGHRVLQSLAHRPTMGAMPIRQLTDRQALQSPVPPDLLEQFHA
jgi:hypothetical protein